jgi:hypothetical protein
MSDERYARRRKGAGEQIAPNALTSPTALVDRSTLIYHADI